MNNKWLAAGLLSAAALVPAAPNTTLTPLEN
jgi:hypothetical protein